MCLQVSKQSLDHLLLNNMENVNLGSYIRVAGQAIYVEFLFISPKNESVDKWDMKDNDEFCLFPWVVISVCLRIVLGLLWLLCIYC